MSSDEDYKHDYKIISLVVRDMLKVTNGNLNSSFFNRLEKRLLKLRKKESINIRIKTDKTRSEKKTVLSLTASGKFYHREEIFLRFIQFLFLQGANPNEKSSNKETFFLVHRNYLKTVKLFLDNGADPNVLNKNSGQTLIFWATRVEMAELLLKYGAKIKVVDNSGWTPLMNTSRSKLIKFFIENGVDVNSRSKRGRTILHDLIYTKRNLKKIKFLLSKGADPNIVSDIGTALEIASDPVEFDSDYSCKLIEMLLRYGAKITEKLKNLSVDVKRIREIFEKHAGNTSLKTLCITEVREHEFSTKGLSEIFYTF